MHKRVRDAMTANPRTVSRTASVVEAAMLMAGGNVGVLPVVDGDDILVGMVTDRDIVLRVVAEGRDPASTRIEEIATAAVSPAYPDEELDEAIEQMAYRQVRRLPVIEDDRVVGILGETDVVREVKAKRAGELVSAISHEYDEH